MALMSLQIVCGVSLSLWYDVCYSLYTKIGLKPNKPKYCSNYFLLRCCQYASTLYYCIDLKGKVRCSGLL